MRNVREVAIYGMPMGPSFGRLAVAEGGEIGVFVGDAASSIYRSIRANSICGYLDRYRVRRTESI